ncbi:MAG: DUF11 domain-containing protein, partial [Candidatus Altiarchaeum hamiconexum]|nr:DUF11 domain-containing protein [Candidatus Altarchaeum hamiconexum]
INKITANYPIDTSSNDSITFTVKKAPQPNLVITKTPKYQEITKGNIVTFTINISNNGTGTAYNLTLNDTLAYDYPEFENMNLTPTFNNTIGDLQPGNSTIITVKFNTSNAYVNSNYTNVVKVVGHKDNETGDIILKTDTANVFINLPPEPSYPKLRITKCVNTSPVNVNDLPSATNWHNFFTCPQDDKSDSKIIIKNYSKNSTLCFRVTIENIGNANIYNVTFYDILPKGFIPYNEYHNNRINEKREEMYSSASVYSYYICANITENASYGWNMNYVHTEGYYLNSTGGYEKTYDEGDVQMYIPEPPDYPKLNVTKTANQSSVITGENVTFIINVTNYGNSTSFNTTFEDIINLNYTYINITGDITNVIINHPPNYTLIIGNLGDISVNESKTFNIILTIGSTVQAMFLRANVITAYGHYNNATGDVVSGTDDEWINITKKKICYPTLSVIKTADVLQIVIGENTTINYTITLNNTGTCIAYNITIKDTLPNGFTTNDNLTFYLDNLTNGSAVTYNIIVYSNIQMNEGDALNKVDVEFRAENMSGEKSRSSITKTIPIVKKEPNLIVTKTPTNDVNIAVGDTINFTIIVNNTGTGTAYNITID